MKKTLASLSLLIALFLTCAPAFASSGTVVYNNGLPTGNDAWTINFGFTVADSFTLTSTANVNHIDFWVDLFPGDILTSVNYTIFTLGPGGKGTFILKTGVAIPVLESSCNLIPCEDYEEGISFTSIKLPAGTYWLKLSNATTNNGNPVFWAESGGPSSAFENSVGTIPSEAFDVVDPPVQGGGTTQ